MVFTISSSRKCITNAMARLETFARLLFAILSNYSLLRFNPLVYFCFIITSVHISSSEKYYCEVFFN